MMRRRSNLWRIWSSQQSSNVPEDAQSPATVEEDEQLPQRIRRRPTWMIDHEVTGIDQFEDPLRHFALLFDCDPTTFEEAVKTSNDGRR